MSPSAQSLTAAEAATRLGVSAKALRLYEERGLISPLRTAAGWRVYGPDQMDRAAEVVELRALGFSLSEVARLLREETGQVERALAAQEAVLAGRVDQLKGTIERVRRRRRDVAHSVAPRASDATRPGSPLESTITFALPWPWDGERFHLAHIAALTYIVGPLGSGKTRLARCIAQAIPGAVFLGIDRAPDCPAAMGGRTGADAARASCAERVLAGLLEEGATPTSSLSCLIDLMTDPGPTAFVIDMIEHGLDTATQQALIAHLRQSADDARPIIMMTRSSAILDVAAVSTEEAIIFCPANHATPTLVQPFPGAPGYEALTSCLATPDVRARTEGVVAWRPTAAHAGHI